MKREILLISGDTELTNSIRQYLRSKDVALHVAQTRAEISKIVNARRPTVFINAILDEKEFKLSRTARLPDGYCRGEDYEYFELYNQPVDHAFTGSILNYLNSLSLPEKGDRDDELFEMRRNKVGIRSGVRASSAVRRRSSEAEKALAEAKEALAAIVSFEADTMNAGNRVVVPLTEDVIQTIEYTLDAAISLTRAPAKGPNTKRSLNNIVSSLQGIERVIKQVEKTVMAAVKVAGVLGILAAAIAVASSKLAALISLLP